MPQLLLELFSEEIPARMQAQAAKDLARLIGDRLAAAGLKPERLNAYAGPRRLALVAEGLPTATADVSEEIKGPKASAPEQALEGFLRKTGLTRDQLVERDGVFFAVVNRPGRPTPEIVAEAVEAAVRGFPWPKSMTWGSGALRWVRPLRRILCLFDGKVAHIEIDGIVSGDLTEGHRFHGSGEPFAVKDFADYQERLLQQAVVLDAEDRKRLIVDEARRLCAERGFELVEDIGLLEEVSGLAEFPHPILGDMDPAFLDLPGEVIRTSMRTHQKYFAVRDPKSGGLAPHFIAVANIKAKDGGVAMAQGYARVLSARLNDARFFWDEDRKVGFEPWLKKLHGATFHARLGTMAQRVERLVAIAREIAPLVGADPDRAAEAARLAKADLASGMVGEFPELQGIMGGYYARAFGLDPEIADAVRDHYRPQGPSDSVPTAPLTVAVALADKLDTLVGFFAIDEKPTGSKDPFALRRAALGIVRILLTSGVRAPLKQLVAAWYQALLTYAGQGRAVYVDTEHFRGSAGPRWSEAHSDSYRNYLRQFREGLLQSPVYVVHDDRDFDLDILWESAPGGPEVREHHLKFAAYETVLADIEAFFADRLKVQLREDGKRHDLVDAVLAVGDDDLVRVVARAEALSAFLSTEDGANLLAGYRRAVNILKAEAKKRPDERYDGSVDVSLLTEPAEIALETGIRTTLSALEPQLERENYAGAMGALATLRQPVDAFFDQVLVNADDAAVRQNRLCLLSQVRAAANQVADLSLITG
jgi:glycyl-tRNA synthetase beta chain